MDFKFRSYQNDCVQSTFEALKEYQHVLNILPTGTGKTEVFIDISRRYTLENPTRGVLILSHLSLLTEQTYERYQSRAPGLNVGILQGQNKPKWSSQVTISTMQTSRNSKHADWIKEEIVRDIGLLIIDEAHYLPTPSYQQILSHFPQAKVVGFTASPFWRSQVMTSFFDKVSYTISLREVIDMGYLVPPRITEIGEKGKCLEDIMATVMKIHRDHQMGRQGIVYMQSIKDARLICSAFQEIGVPARAITKELTGDYRKQILNDFNSGRIHILSTVNVLTAGFDSPKVQCIYMPYGTKSPTTYVQRIGRGLRLDKEANKTHCDVYVFGDAPSVSRKLAERLTNKILNANGTPKNYNTFREDWEFNEYETGSDIYVWNKSVIDTIHKMEKLGMSNFAKMLNEKEFPKQFMTSIDKFLDNLPEKKLSLANGKAAASEAQKTILFKMGFGSQALSKLSKNEAHMMISSVLNSKNHERMKSQPQFVVPDGTHKGKQVWELPHAYRTLVKKRYPDSPVAKIILEFETSQKRKKKA